MNMQLRSLIQSVAYTKISDEALLEKEVCTVQTDNRAVGVGDVFICIRGLHRDGHDFAESALKAGAAAIVCERDLGLERQILVEDTRVAWAYMCRNFYGNPQKDLHLIAVTGTSGKTTVTCLIRDILRTAGKKVGLIGTIQGEIGDMIIPARHTTPDPAQLYAMLARMRAAGIEYVVMEASSHALDQHRVDGLHFDVAAFLNLSREHLDYHKTMEDYYAAKRSLFSLAKSAVIVIDDEYGRRLCADVSCPVTTVSVKDNAADFTAHSITFSAKGSRFVVVNGSRLERLRIGMPGEYSVCNAVCAFACATAVGVDFSTAARGLRESEGVSGRMERIAADVPFTIIRDYAHTPEELENVLRTVRRFAPGRILTLFGCPGERDRGKRPQMAQAVARYSDLAILTSDNPRREDPGQIIADAMPGFDGSPVPVQVIEDRYDAICWAMEKAQAGDTLLLLGKGHEDYQVLGFGTIYFDERFIVQEIVRKMHGQDAR